MASASTVMCCCPVTCRVRRGRPAAARLRRWSGDRYQAFAGRLEGKKVAGLGVVAEALGKLLALRADLAAPFLLPLQHPRDGGADRFGRERIKVVGELGR